MVLLKTMGLVCEKERKKMLSVRRQVKKGVRVRRCSSLIKKAEGMKK